MPVRLLLRRLIFVVLAALGVAAPATAVDTGALARSKKFKDMEVRFMMREAREREVVYQARARAARGRKAGPRTGEKLEPARQEPPDPAMPQRIGTARAARLAGLTAIATNHIVNNRAGDSAPGSGQCEVSIAAFGNNVVAAWNDGEGFLTSTSTQGYAYSNNGGATWVDGGAPPTSGGVTNWTSDPVVTVNDKTGDFYFAALCEPSGTTNGVGVVKGTFSGGVLTWGTPEVAVSGNNSSAIYDKEWVAADSTTGNVYLIYSKFTVVGGNITSNSIQFQRKTTPIGWGAATQVSSAGDAGRVQGARVVLGPAGDVWITWNAIGKGIAGGDPTDEDYMRVRKSPSGGSLFGAEVTGVKQYTNYGSGAPGFNRGMGFAFPSFAVDRSTGAHRGRAFLCWNESINFYDDNIGNTGTIAESEPNDTPFTGDAFTMGKHLTGTITSTSDFDYFQFAATAGQTIICAIDASTAPTLDASFRLFCSDATTRLAFSETGAGGSGLIVFTIPTTGTYTLRVAAFSGSGNYTIDTGLNGAVTERARDSRDVFTNFTDNTSTWSTPVRVNGDASGLDDWLPEIAVSGDGRVYTSWYDWRDAPGSTCNGQSMVYLARSTDGGATWPDGSPVTDNLTAWTTVSSNIAPNQGDYTSLFANQSNVYVCWSDGRNADPDVFMAAPVLAFTPVLVSVANTEVEPGRVTITWYSADAGFNATVYRSSAGGPWTALGEVTPNGEGQLVFEDRTVAAGTSYRYRLGVVENGQESFMGEVTVEVPAATALAIEEVHPIPADREMSVSFTLAGAAPATLELIDVSGRRVREQQVAGAGRHTVDLMAGVRLAPGIYLIRLTQAGQSVVKRVSVVR